MPSRQTLYELAVECGEERYLVAYCNRRSRQMTLDACRQRGEAVVKVCLSARICFARRAGDGATVGKWAVRFTGRTEREAKSAGELPYIVDIAADRAQVAVA